MSRVQELAGMLEQCPYEDCMAQGVHRLPQDQ